MRELCRCWPRTGPTGAIVAAGLSALTALPLMVTGAGPAAAAAAVSLTPVSTSAASAPLPAAAAVAVEGTDGQMWVQAPQLPAGWQPFGGVIVGPPAVAAAWNPNGTTLAAPLFFATGSSGQMWMRSLTAGWHPVGPSQAFCIGGPAAVVTSDGTLTVACEGTNRQLFYNKTTMPSSGLPAFTGPWTSLGGILSAGPAIAPVGGTLTFFVDGTNRQVFTNTGSGFTPTPWFCIGNPAAALYPATGFTFFACRGLDSALWEDETAGSVWDDATQEGVGFPLTGSPAIAGTGQGPEIYYEATGPGVWELGPVGPPGAGPIGGIAVGGVGAAPLD